MCYVSRVCFFLDKPLVFVGSLIGSRFHIGQRRLSDATDTLHLQSQRKKTMIWVGQQHLYVGSEPIDGRCVHILAYSMLQRSEVVSTYPRHAAHAPQSMPFAHKRLILPRLGDFWPWAPMCYVSRVCFFLDKPLVFVGSLIDSSFHIQYITTLLPPLTHPKSRLCPYLCAQGRHLPCRNPWGILHPQ